MVAASAIISGGTHLIKLCCIVHLKLIVFCKFLQNLFINTPTAVANEAQNPSLEKIGLRKSF